MFQNLDLLFQDLRASWVIILGCLAAGAVFGLIWICLMRCFAGIMVWFSLIGMIVVLGFSKFNNFEADFKHLININQLISSEIIY